MSKKTRWLFTAALSATLTAGAWAQFRVGTDGRGNDANNRIGGSGLNENNNFWQGRAWGYQGNNVITGNVTGGREFRGFVPYTDPGAFRGTTAGSSMDRFIRGSYAAPFGGVQSNNTQVVQPFYGSSRAAPPPPGYVQQSGASGAYVPRPTMTMDPGDLRLGVTNAAPPSALPLPGQLILPGPVNPNTQTNSLITASPLYGVRKWDLGAESDQLFLSNMLDTASNGALARTNPQLFNQLRQELLTTGPIDQRVDQTALQPDGTPGAEKPNRQQINDAVQTPFESPQNKVMGGGTEIKSTQTSAEAGLNANLATGAGVTQRLLSAQQQSTQYGELTKRLQQYRVVQEMADSRARQQLQQQIREATQQPGTTTEQRTGPGTGQGEGGVGGGVGPGMPGGAQPGVTPALPGAGAAPGAAQGPGSIQIPGNVDTAPTLPRPVQIKSLADGIQAKGLTDLLKQAEEQMKAGKYNSALEQYDMAEQVAPNNPLILVGRANVELARTYYARAETNLRSAFLQDQALLMGQYDLREMIGNDRLEILVKELKEITNREAKEARPAFLLAYIAYNTGNERMAAAYLDLAEKRAGASDPLYPLIRKHWSLPKAASPEDMNK
jgi:tetratricopeptide (TPR) repeat protein